MFRVKLDDLEPQLGSDETPQLAAPLTLVRRR
jgi:hypothetical protein